MSLKRKNLVRPPAPPPSTIYVRPGDNRVLAEEFEALKHKRAGLVQDKIEAHSQGDLRENFGFKAAKDAKCDVCSPSEGPKGPAHNF